MYARMSLPYCLLNSKKENLAIETKNDYDPADQKLRPVQCRLEVMPVLLTDFCEFATEGNKS